jgi:hypothetical protein
MNWLDRARGGIQKSARKRTANTAERTLTTVTAVPPLAFSSSETRSPTRVRDLAIGAFHELDEIDSLATGPEQEQRLQVVQDWIDHTWLSIPEVARREALISTGHETKESATITTANTAIGVLSAVLAVPVGRPDLHDNSEVPNHTF